MDKELPNFVPPAHFRPPNDFILFVSATLKTGKPIRFLMHTIWMGEVKFALGIAEVPEGANNAAQAVLNWN